MHRGAAWGIVGAIAAAAAAVIGAGGLILRPVPTLSVTTYQVTSASQPAQAQISWPQVREAAVTVEGFGRTWSHGTQAEVPMASITKIMTAYIILRDHPLSGDEQGPLIPVTAEDAQEYKSSLKAGDSSAKVAAGESLTERQALEALMLPSADNVAWLLATWDAGSTDAFAGKMNTVARSLGMHHTDYTDPSGLDATTVSTAVDQLALVRAAMKLPVFAQIVAMPSATIPVAGTIANYNGRTGTDGIVGIKTGTTSQAGGCWAFAVNRHVGGATHLVYGVVFGAPLLAGNQQAAAAIDAGLNLADAMPGTVRKLTVLPAGAAVGQIIVPWSKTPVPVVTARPLAGLAVAGTHITLSPRASLPATALAPGATLAGGAAVGEVTATGLTRPASVPLVTASAVSKPSLAWRLSR